MPFNDIIGHERPKALLQASILHDRVAHAYLFFGEHGIGKRLAALRFTQALNCDSDTGPEGLDACGSCQSCRQIEALTYPDLIVVEPEQERATPQIKIEQIREVREHIVYRPLIGRRKVCVIDEADRMTLSAANALLKTLEEPPAHSLFLLITSRPSALPVTVRSRCQGLRFAAPARTQVEAALIVKRELPPDDARFLAIVTESRLGDALKSDLDAIRAQQEEFRSLTARTTLDSIPQLLTAAEALSKADRAEEVLEWIARWVRDLALIRIGADPDYLLSAGSPEHLDQAAGGVSLDALLSLLDAIEAFQRGATRNLNHQLAVENILLRLRDAFHAQPSEA